MPTYKVTDPQTGQTLRLTGDSPPTEAELVQIFASISAPGVTQAATIQRQQEAQDGNVLRNVTDTAIPQRTDDSGEVDNRGLFRKTFDDTLGALASAAETGATIGSSIVAEPISGLAGIAQALNPFAEEGAGARAVEATRQALTYIPKTEGGQANIQAIGEVLAPVADTLKAAEDKLGSETLEATGSPALAAAAATAPTALLEILGIASAKGSIKASDNIKQAADTAAVKRAVVESAPSIDELKNTARAVYNELDESGVKLSKGSFENLVKKTENQLRRQGFDEDLTPKTAAALNRLKSEVAKDSAPTLSEFDILRRVSQRAAQSVDPADASLGVMIIENIDDFLDNADPSKFGRGGAVPVEEIAPKYRAARDLWGRARRSELINEAMEKARDQASGFENGIRIQLRQILNNKKKSKFFKPDEVDAMKSVVQGTTASNLAKLVGKLGFSENQATNLLGASVGAGGGFAIGGAPGAIAVPAIGTVTRNLAQRLTRKGAEFADAVVRAGNDGQDIAAAYLRNTPKAQRSADELSELLIRPGVSLDELSQSGSKILKDAADIARGRRVLSLAAGAAAPGAIKNTQQEGSL